LNRIGGMSFQFDATARNADQAFRLIRVRLAQLFAFFEQVGVTEVNYNGPDDAWVTRCGQRERVTVHALGEVSVTAAVRELASSMGQETMASSVSAMVDARMPGFRFSAILYPVAAHGTSLSIRKHSPRVLGLDDYVAQGLIPPSVAMLLAERVRAGSNMLIGGGTDSGKTTFLNALSREIPVNERVGTIEDTRELALIVPNWLALETNAQRGVSATLCLKALMRNSIDRIICGELRDIEAADFLSSANTGHHGCMATVHCSSAGSAMARLEDLCLKADSNWPLLAIQRNLGRTIHLVAHFRKVAGRRRLNELLEVHGFDAPRSVYETTSIFNHQEPDA
jgi:pilus assembly protein CpaF